MPELAGWLMMEHLRHPRRAMLDDVWKQSSGGEIGGVGMGCISHFWIFKGRVWSPLEREHNLLGFFMRDTAGRMGSVLRARVVGLSLNSEGDFDFCFGCCVNSAVRGPGRCQLPLAWLSTLVVLWAKAWIAAEVKQLGVLSVLVMFWPMHFHSSGKLGPPCRFGMDCSGRSHDLHPCQKACSVLCRPERVLVHLDCRKCIQWSRPGRFWVHMHASW